MPEFETSRTVKHPAGDMFDLVADVKSYPRFVPLCRALNIRRHDTLPDGREILIAEMTVAYKFIKESFTSRVILDRSNNTIHVTYLNGPFKEMNNKWTFVPRDDSHCEVHFFIKYEFASRSLAAMMGSVFDHAFRRFASAFEERADEVYGVTA